MVKKGKIFAVLSAGLFIAALCAGTAFGILRETGEHRETEAQEETEVRGESKAWGETGVQGESEVRGKKEAPKETEAPKEWEPQSETEKGGETGTVLTETAIHYQVVYNMEVTSPSMAAAAIAEEGRRQRENYDNPAVEAIELKMEEEFGIPAVNLGEMSEETALEVYRGFAYMYEKYPCLQGSLTNLTLGNMGNKTGGTIALTDRMEFIVNGDYGDFPFVEKYYIVLNARVFLDDKKLWKTCEDMAESGYWLEGASPSSVLVHELGHQLQNVIVQKRFGLECPYYITEENADAFGLYNADRLSTEDNTTEDILNRAYERWQEVYGNRGGYEEFVKSISGYAFRDEKEDRYSPSETFAEAVADVYLNGEDAADASRAVTDVIDGILASDGETFQY